MQSENKELEHSQLRGKCSGRVVRCAWSVLYVSTSVEFIKTNNNNNNNKKTI